MRSPLEESATRPTSGHQTARDLHLADQPLFANPRAILERSCRHGLLDARFKRLGTAGRSILAAAQDMAGADGEDPGHGEPGLGRSASRRITRPPTARNDGFAFLDLPGHLAEGVNTVGRLVDGEPEARALDQLLIHEFLFLDDRRLEFSDPGNVERLGLVENAVSLRN